MSDRVGVMSQGVLQQVGTPQEIYNTPANGFVASFVGENNIFPGRVAAIEGDWRASRRRSGTFLTRLGPGIVLGGHGQALCPARARDAGGRRADGRNSIPVEVRTSPSRAISSTSMPATSMAACTCRRCATIPNAPPPLARLEAAICASRPSMPSSWPTRPCAAGPEGAGDGRAPPPLWRHADRGDPGADGLLAAGPGDPALLHPVRVFVPALSAGRRARRAARHLHPQQLRHLLHRARSTSTSSSRRCCLLLVRHRRSAWSWPIRSPTIWPRSPHPRMRRRCSCCCSSRSGSARSCAPSPGSSSCPIRGR